MQIFLHFVLSFTAFLLIINVTGFCPAKVLKSRFKERSPMEQQIQDLVDSIKKEGLQQAQTQRDEIISQAKAEADRIINEARTKAGKMIEDAQRECALREQSARASIEQAARNVAITLKEDLNAQLSKILALQVGEALNKTLLSKLVLSVVDASLKDAVIEIGGPDAEKLTKQLAADLAGKLKNGLELSAGGKEKGLKIVSKDGSGYIDLSAEEMTRLLRPYLSDSIKEIIY